MDFLFHFTLLLVMLATAAFFSSAETAIFSLTKAEKKRLSERRSFFAKLVIHHLEHPRHALAAILIGNLLAHTLAAALVTLMAHYYLGTAWISFCLVIFTVIVIFSAEIVPKTFAVGNNQNVALIAALPLKIFQVSIFPIRWIVRLMSDKVLSFLISDRKEHSEKVSGEEILTLVKIGEEEGVLDSQERYMLQKLLELGERPAKDIMTPRIYLIALNVDDPREENIALIQKHHFSRFPVFQETVDNLIGIVSVQDYMLFPEKTLQDLIRHPLYVPEVKRINDLLKEFRSQDQNFAVCLDEYGGTAGVVTLEDILEEIFGEFYDEYAKVEHPIRSIGHQEYIVEAKLPLADFNEYFSFDLKSEDASTLGGYLLEKIGELPEKGRSLKIEECEFVIHEVIRHKRIKTIIVRPGA